MRKTILLFLICMGFCITSIYAQNLKITGVVTSQTDGATLPGVSIIVKSTSTGTTTDDNGNYSIEVPQGAILVFSFLGMLPEEVSIESSGVYNVVLMPDLIMMQEVVVTALGIKREKKSLGYAIQEVSGDVLLETKETNIANSLTGKVSGLQVVRSSSGPAGSSKIVIRGHSSLTGDNQPLIVVDGMPLNNFTGAQNNDYWNPSLDMGSGIADLNPEDIESISVLKGASAAALYGSRAGNGVILITTKKGSSQPGLGITFSSSLGVESVFTHPELQNSFGQGNYGIFDNLSGASWGPEINGDLVENWDGREVPLSAYDNVTNFFDLGINQNYNLSFQQQHKSSSIYTSITRKDDKSMIPNTSLTRTNLLTRAVSKFGKNEKWTVDAKVQYLNAVAKNRPLLGTNSSNAYYTMYMLPRSLDIRDFKKSTDEFGNMIWYNTSGALNPYWTTEYNQNSDERDRFLLYSSLKYEFTEWLNAEINAGSDLYTTNRESKLYKGSPISTNGRYSMGKDTFFENNFSTLISAGKKDLVGKLGVASTVGGNIMMRESSGISGSSGEMVVPNLFMLNNSVSNPTVGESFSQMRIVSMYGTLQLSWDDYFFIDGTFRNDWSSTLSKENQSYFYPSISTSLVFSDMLEQMNISLPSWITFGKVRASIAQVGNSLGPYQLYNTYSIGNDPLGVTTAWTGSTLYDPNVLSELITSRELGADIRFFENRIGIDFTWYKSNATRQLINLPMDPLSGYSSKKINAGDIQNKGIELMVNARILDNKEGFSWHTQFNYSTNKNTVEELTEDVHFYQIGGFDNLQILAEAGGLYGQIYGTTYLRVEDEESEHFGKLLLNANGYPLADPERKILGSQQADALMGITNTFMYKGLSLSFMFDGRFGGKMFSTTNRNLQLAGTAKITAPNGMREDIIVEGVIDNGDGTYSANDIALSQQDYWQTITAISGNLGVIEANLYDATNVRLRYISINYDLPKNLVQKTPLQRASVGVSVNNVWLIKSYLNGVDPESVYATGTNALGFENSAPPTTRTVLFNLNLSF
jgi:TonB-linked SusC/RagA family outer membrane protein